MNWKDNGIGDRRGLFRGHIDMKSEAWSLGFGEFEKPLMDFIADQVAIHCPQGDFLEGIHEDSFGVSPIQFLFLSRVALRVADLFEVYPVHL